MQLIDILSCKRAISYFATEKNVTICHLLIAKWSVLKEIVYISCIPYKATVALQKNDITLSDVYGIWLKMEIHLKHCMTKKTFKTKLAICMNDTVKERKKTIFESTLMQCAIFLDPRFRKEITNDPQKVALVKQNLIQIWNKVNFTQTQAETSNNSALSSNFGSDFDEDAELNKYLAQSGQNELNISQENTSEARTRIDSIIDTFNPKILPTKDSVLQFWFSVKNEHPELYQLALIIYSVSPTEVQIERDFSKMGYIFNDRRCALIQERLEDIMIINLNPDLFYSVQADEMKIAEKN